MIFMTIDEYRTALLSIIAETLKVNLLESVLATQS